MGDFVDGYNIAEKIIPLQIENEKTKLMLQQLYVIIEHNIKIGKLEEPKETKEMKE